MNGNKYDTVNHRKLIKIIPQESANSQSHYRLLAELDIFRLTQWRDQQMKNKKTTGFQTT